MACDTNNLDRTLRGIAGSVTLFAVAMYFVHSPNWIYFIAFVGANLLQSAFTNWCPMITFLKLTFFKEKQS